MIKAQNVQKWFGPNLAVDRVSFEVKPGEVLGFLGPHGAGKTTTMRMLTGFLPLSGGKITIGNHDIEEDPIAAKTMFGYLPENAPAYTDMTVQQFLAFSAAIRGLSGPAKDDAVEKAIATATWNASAANPSRPCPKDIFTALVSRKPSCMTRRS